MKIDTEFPMCVIARNLFAQHCKPWPKLRPSQLPLSRYVAKLTVQSELELMVTHQGVLVKCKLVVLDCTGPSLCRRDLIKMLDKASVSVLQVGRGVAPGTVQTLSHDNTRAEYTDVFSEESGLIKGLPASLLLKGGAVPNFRKARSLPCAIRDKVAQGLERLVSLGIISTVKH